MAGAVEEERGQPVHADAHECHDDDGHSRHRLGVRQALHRSEDDRADGDQQDDGVEERHQDRGTAQPVGIATARAAPRQRDRAPRGGEAQDIAEIVAGIGQKRDRMGDETKQRLDADKGEIERDADGKNHGGVARERTGVVMMAVVMAMAAVVMAVVGVLVRTVIVRHRPDFA